MSKSIAPFHRQPLQRPLRNTRDIRRRSSFSSQKKASARNYDSVIPSLPLSTIRWKRNGPPSLRRQGCCNVRDTFADTFPSRSESVTAPAARSHRRLNYEISSAAISGRVLAKDPSALNATLNLFLSKESGIRFCAAICRCRYCDTISQYRGDRYSA